MQIDIPNSLDHLWKIDVKKSKASPPENIKKELRLIINQIATSGKKVYRQRGKKLSERIKEPAWNRFQDKGKIQYTINKDHYLFTNLENELNNKQKCKLNALISMLESSFPSELFYSDFAEKPEFLDKSNFDIGLFTPMLDAMISTMKNNKIPTNEIIERILACDPFATYPDETLKILKDKGYRHD